MQHYKELTPEQKREYGFIKLSKLEIKRIAPGIAKQMISSDNICSLPQGKFPLSHQPK